MSDKDQIIIAWLREMKDRATASGEYLYLQYLDMAIRRMNEAGEYSENFETADDYLKRLGDVFWQQIENEQKGTAFQTAAMTFMWGKYTNWGQGYPKNIPEPEFKGVQLEGAGSTKISRTKVELDDLAKDPAHGGRIDAICRHFGSNKTTP